MAKKQSAPSREKKVAETTKKEQTPPSNGPKRPVARESAVKKPPTAAAPLAAQRVLNQNEIGAIAGEVWHLLAERGGQNLSALKKAVNAPGDLVSAAIGWLAREGKLEFTASGRSVKVSLR